MNVNLCVGEGGIPTTSSFYILRKHWKGTNSMIILFFFTCKCKKNVCCEKKGGRRGGGGGIVSAMFCCTVDLFTEIRYLKTYGTDHSPWIYEFLKPTELLPTILTQVRAGRSTLGRHDDFPMTIQKTFAVWSKEKRKDSCCLRWVRLFVALRGI